MSQFTEKNFHCAQDMRLYIANKLADERNVEN